MIIDFTVIPDLEVTAVAALRDLANSQRAEGVTVWSSDFTREQARMFRRYGPIAESTRGFPTVEKAIAAVRSEGSAQFVT